MIHQDETMLNITNKMFSDAARRESETPIGTASVKDLDEFLVLLNHIFTTVTPEFTICLNDATSSLDPCGLIGFPINALLDWPMATSSGYVVFSNALINQQLKKVLMYWTKFLTSHESTYALTKNDPNSTPIVIGWLSDPAKIQLVKVVTEATGSNTTPDMT
mmetsp:Transcript_20173/g.26011  ORF Transcript_20173/g.26011 Transcript_20173/m.26011 type:complete len:162 (-) Transcript_20173:37-522(-)